MNSSEPCSAINSRIPESIPFFILPLLFFPTHFHGILMPVLVLEDPELIEMNCKSSWNDDLIWSTGVWEAVTFIYYVNQTKTL